MIIVPDDGIVRPMPSLSIHHLAVCVTDLERAEAFYVGVLGLPVQRRWEDAEERPRAIWLDLGHGAFLAVEKVSGSTRRDDEDPGWHCVALRIEAGRREQWRRHLADSGHPVERETEHTLYVRDPDGSIVALSHY